MSQAITEMMSQLFLPVGFRFHPTDEEVIDHYLKLKILGMDSHVQIIPVVDVCNFEPWDLPARSFQYKDDRECFFFCPPDFKYPNGRRSNRSTGHGYWKPTGKDRNIKLRANSEVIGTKKTLVFYEGRAPTSKRTNWVMHEYRATMSSLPANRTFVLCWLKRKVDENLESDIPNHIEVAAGGFSSRTNSNGTGFHINDPVGSEHRNQDRNMDFDIRDYLLETEDQDSQQEGIFNETTLDYDFSSDAEHGSPSDYFPFANGFNNAHQKVQFQEEDDEQDDDVARFLKTSEVDGNEQLHQEAIGQSSSALKNLNHGSIGRLSARPQTPLKGVYPKGGGSSSDTDNEVCMMMVEGEYPQPFGTNQYRKVDRAPHVKIFLNKSSDHTGAFGVGPRKIKLERKVTDEIIHRAEFTESSSSVSKPKDKPTSIKVKARANLPQAKNPIRDPKKDGESTQKASTNLSSIAGWNRPVGSNHPANDELCSSPGCLVNLLVGILLFVTFIAVMVLDVNAKVSKTLQ